MRRVPGMRGLVVAQPLAVVVAEHHRALRRARVVLAGVVGAVGEGRPVRPGAGEDVVPVRLVAAAVDDLALLREVVLLGQLVVRAVQIGNAGGDDDALGVGPGALADAVARVHRAGALRGQIGVPGLAARAGGLREALAVRVGAGETAEVRAFARTVAGDEEGHAGLLRLRWRQSEQRETGGKRRSDTDIDHVDVSPAAWRGRSAGHRLRGRTPRRWRYSGAAGRAGIKKPGVSAGLRYRSRYAQPHIGCKLPAACLPRSVTMS